MSLSIFEMHSVELFCQTPLGACYVICDEWHYKACLGKAADLQKARAETQEFLGIAELNHRHWEEDRPLVRRLVDRKLLAFHGVRNWNPNTDGWWIINALLDDVRNGARLAIKGPRADLFPPSHGAPLRHLPARAVYPADGEPMQSGRYGSATQQTRLAATRVAMSGSNRDGGLLHAAVVTAGPLARDGNTSTLPGDAQPFAYTPDAVSGEAEQLAASTNNPRFAAKMLGYDYKTFGTMLHKFKDRNGPGPADNSIFHDNGDVEFNGHIFEDSIHDYAP
ncbi:hypothetical protein BH160DRAFT_4314 [Burkholderia sp. H160]|nr:hypothetical protein BH160DRAFT_4314 [Burkholderia sp. H160]